MPKKLSIHAFKKVQLSEKVHHWTPDGSYGSRDFNFPTNVPMKLSSFDVGSLIATIFGKLKLPSQPRAEDDDDDGERIQGVQAHVPLRPGMEYPRKRKALTPTIRAPPLKGIEARGIYIYTYILYMYIYTITPP